MNEPLGIALELAAKRKAFARRLSPLARRLAYPQWVEYRVTVEYRVRANNKAVLGGEQEQSDWVSFRGPLTKIRSSERAIERQPQAAVIVQVCARHWSVTDNAIYSRARKLPIVLPRHAACVLMRELLGLSFPSIGVILRRDHTTAMHSIRKHADLYETSEDYRQRYDAAEAEVRSLISTETPRPDTVAAGGERDGCPRQPSPTLPANHQREAA